MRMFNVVIERDSDTRLFVGHVPGWPGAHSQAESLDELQANLQEVVSMLLENGAEVRVQSGHFSHPQALIASVARLRNQAQR